MVINNVNFEIPANNMLLKILGIQKILTLCTAMSFVDAN